MATSITELPYFEARENFKKAMALHSSQERRLFELFDVATSADLELAILASRSDGLKHHEEIAKFAQLGHALDRAADVLDLATERQKRKIAEQQKQLNKTFQNLDC